MDSDFNEARAFCAGNYFNKLPALALHGDFNEARAFCAGNFFAHKTGANRGRSFNEARAFCAGNWGQPRRPRERRVPLQ